AAVFLSGRKYRGRHEGRIAIVAATHRAHRAPYRRDIAMTAELAHKAAARTECTVNSSNHKFRLAHPIQRGIGEERVELGDEVQRVSIHFADSEPLHARDRKQLVAQIDAK